MSIQIIQSVQNRIYEFRNRRVILDSDLANLFEVEPQVLNLSVKLNRELFPEDFFFQIEHYECIKYRLRAINQNASAQIVRIINLPKDLTGDDLPYAFTIEGVAMLSSVLHTHKAVCIKNAFLKAHVAFEPEVLKKTDFNQQLQKLKYNQCGHNSQLNDIYEAMENLLDENAAQRKWEGRRRIGFVSYE